MKIGRALEIGASISNAAVSRSPQAAFSTIPDVINLYHAGKGIFLGRFVYNGISSIKLFFQLNINTFFIKNKYLPLSYILLHLYKRVLISNRDGKKRIIDIDNFNNSLNIL